MNYAKFILLLICAFALGVHKGAGTWFLLPFAVVLGYACRWDIERQLELQERARKADEA